MTEIVFAQYVPSMPDWIWVMNSKAIGGFKINSTEDFLYRFSDYVEECDPTSDFCNDDDTAAGSCIDFMPYVFTACDISA